LFNDKKIGEKRKMNSKKAITLLVLATLLMTLVPIFPASADLSPLVLEDTDGAPVTDGVYGDTVVVLGQDGDVPAGTTIELYWDDTTINWNGVKGKLNSTTADSDGGYEIWFDVPESVNGDHYIWIKAGSDSISALFDVLADVDPASSSGLEGDRIDVDVFGQSKEKDIGMVMVQPAGVWNWVLAPQVTEPTDGAETEFDGTLPSPGGDFVGPLTVTITAGAVVLTDDGTGDLTGAGGDGSINYVTGEWDVEFDVAPAAGTFTIDYFEFQENAVNHVLSSGGTTNAVGSYMKRITVPDPIAYGLFSIETLDAKGVSGGADFTIGAVITATPDEVAVGDRVTVKGRGFTGGGTISYPDVTVGGIPCLIVDYDDPEIIDGDGDFNFEIFVPSVNDEDDYDLMVSDGVLTADVEIEVTALAEITITPDYGPQGQTVAISGMNFPNLKEDDSITVDLTGGDPVPLVTPVEIKTFDSNSDGTFSGTMRIPAELDGTYTIVAYWEDPDGILPDTTNEADDDFRIGSVLVLLSDDEGPTGLEVILSGNGFTEAEGWNATFGGITIFEDETVAAGGLLKQGLDAAVFYVPQVAPGTYDIVVMDEDTEIEVVTEFTVTDTTTFEMSPAEAPSGYNITFEGRYWSEDVAPDFEFWVFNDTEEWEITGDVLWGDPGVQLITWPVADLDYGAFDAWWVMELPNGDDWSKGTYMMNVTYGDDFLIQTEFVVGDEHVSIAPRKSTFRIGDTLSFNIQHSFGNVHPADDGEIYDGEIDIKDPNGNLYFETDGLVTWERSGLFYFVPVSGQTANMNPMILLDDAPLGEWSYMWYKNDDGDNELIAEGTFEVAESAEDVVSGKIDNLNKDLLELQKDVSGVTEEFKSVKSDIAGVKAVAEQAVKAANQAAEAVATVAQTANQANTAAENAAEAANAAKDAANSLTTLVYGAIGAALVAALAAIVSLMQISRRIAG
jgi:hypothetical protein